MRHVAKEEIADLVAHAVAKSESVGNRICGLYYLESYCQNLVTGRVNGAFEPEVFKPKEPAIYVDAGFGFAQLAFAKGLPDAVTSAQTFGVSTVSAGTRPYLYIAGICHGTDRARRFDWHGFYQCIFYRCGPWWQNVHYGKNLLAFSVPDGEGGI